MDGDVVSKVKRVDKWLSDFDYDNLSEADNDRYNYAINGNFCIVEHKSRACSSHDGLLKMTAIYFN